MQITLPDATPISSFIPGSMNALAYGRSGTGKTHFAATFPKPVLFIDADKGMLSVKASTRLKDKDQIFFVPVADKLEGQKVNNPMGFVTIKAVFDQLKSSGKYGELSPKTLVLDTLTSASAFCMKHVLFSAGHVGQQPTQPDWGTFRRELIYIIEVGIALDINFICLAHEQYIKDELSGRTWCLPMLNGKLAYELSGYFDEVYHMEPKQIGTQTKYQMTIKATGLVTAKSRLDLDSPIDSDYAIIKPAWDRLNSDNTKTEVKKMPEK